MNYQTFNEPYTFKEPYITNKNRGQDQYENKIN